MRSMNVHCLCIILTLTFRSVLIIYRGLFIDEPQFFPSVVFWYDATCSLIFVNFQQYYFKNAWLILLSFSQSNCTNALVSRYLGNGLKSGPIKSMQGKYTGFKYLIKYLKNILLYDYFNTRICDVDTWIIENLWTKVPLTKVFLHMNSSNVTQVIFGG